eukprot:PhM_4_TR9820/c1_g1_i1/m.23096
MLTSNRHMEKYHMLFLIIIAATLSLLSSTTRAELSPSAVLSFGVKNANELQVGNHSYPVDAAAFAEHSHVLPSEYRHLSLIVAVSTSQKLGFFLAMPNPEA